jgi:hypothetical protein
VYAFENLSFYKSTIQPRSPERYNNELYSDELTMTQI